MAERVVICKISREGGYLQQYRKDISPLQNKQRGWSFAKVKQRGGSFGTLAQRVVI